MSRVRPTMVSQPPASTVARSPVRNQVPWVAARVWSASAYPANSSGPRSSSSPGSPDPDPATGHLVHHPELGLADHPAVGVAGPVGGIVPCRGGDGRGLGRAVGPLDGGVEGFPGRVDELGGDGHRPAGDDPETGHGFGGEAGGPGHAREVGRRPDHEADASLRNEPVGPLGVPALHQHRAHADGDREQHPAEQSGDVGQRGRHEHGVGRSEPVGTRHGPRLVGQAPVGVEHHFRLPGGARREQGHREVDAPRHAVVDRGVARQVVPGVAPVHHDAAWSVRQRGARVGQHQPGIDGGDHGGDVGGPHLMVDGYGHGPDPPTGPEQQHGLDPVGELPGDGVAAAHAGRPEPAGQRADGGRRRRGVERARGVGQGDTGRLRGDAGQPVERRHVPGPSRTEVAGGRGLPERGSKPHREPARSGPVRRPVTVRCLSRRACNRTCSLRRRPRRPPWARRPPGAPRRCPGAGRRPRGGTRTRGGVLPRAGPHGC